jgi:hypothetical protein
MNASQQLSIFQVSEMVAFINSDEISNSYASKVSFQESQRGI